MSDSKYDRRSAERLSKQVPALLHRDMVETINISEEGARLIVKSKTPLKSRVPLLIQTGENDYAGLLCEPRWVKKLGKDLYVVGVSFPEGQEDINHLKRTLLKREP
jgi:PilZ domain-containing protein